MISVPQRSCLEFDLKFEAKKLVLTNLTVFVSDARGKVKKFKSKTIKLKLYQNWFRQASTEPNDGRISSDGEARFDLLYSGHYLDDVDGQAYTIGLITLTSKTTAKISVSSFGETGASSWGCAANVEIENLIITPME